MLPIDITQIMNEVQDQLSFKFSEEKFLLLTLHRLRDCIWLINVFRKK